MDTKTTEDSVIVTPVKARESFNGGTVCAISPDAQSTLESLCGGHHSRREIEPYLNIASSPLYQPGNN